MELVLTKKGLDDNRGLLKSVQVMRLCVSVAERNLAGVQVNVQTFESAASQQ